MLTIQGARRARSVLLAIIKIGMGALTASLVRSDTFKASPEVRTVQLALKHTTPIASGARAAREARAKREQKCLRRLALVNLVPLERFRGLVPLIVRHVLQAHFPASQGPRPAVRAQWERSLTAQEARHVPSARWVITRARQGAMRASFALRDITPTLQAAHLAPSVLKIVCSGGTSRV